MFFRYLSEDPAYYIAVVVTVVISICIHELAHGLVAIRLGDRTPIETERMTLNPLVHMGGMSMVMLLLTGIAWGSMPIDPTRMRGRFSEALVAIAGPVSNVLLALFSLTALGLWMRFGAATAGSTAASLWHLLLIFGMTNLSLALFNLLPCPPLDGFHVLANFVPQFGAAMQSASASGGTIVLFLIVFMFAGRIIFPAAEWMTTQYLMLLR